MVPVFTSTNASNINAFNNVFIKIMFTGYKTVRKGKGAIITKVRKVITSHEREEEAIGQGHKGDF